MFSAIITPLTSAELDALRGERVVVSNGRRFRLVGEEKGVQAYVGLDQEHILGIIEDGGNGTSVVLTTSAGEHNLLFEGPNDQVVSLISHKVACALVR